MLLGRHSDPALVADQWLQANQSDLNTSSTSEEEAHHGIHLASLNFEYVAEPLIISLFIFVAAMLKMGFHYAHFLSSVVPESCLLILVGVAFEGVMMIFGLHDMFSLNPRTFMLFLLPPIILDAAYSLNDRVFAENLGTILLYAVVGTLINFLLMGVTLWGIWKGNAMGIIWVNDEPYDFSLSESYLFASFIVAVDPVAVLAIFDEVGVNAVLYFLVFGESLLNDAVTVVLNNMMKVFVEMDDDIPAGEIVLAILSFFTISLGGLAIGLSFGIFTSLVTRVTYHARVIEPLTVLILAHLAYLCAELFHWSGIISMIGCGLLQAQYSFHNISRKSYTTVKYFTKMMSAVCDALIFMFLGVELLSSNHVWNTGFTLWAVFFCIIYRFITVFGLTYLANFFRTPKVNPQEQFIMWYGGLRGAVCFALCETMRDHLELKGMFLTTTLVVICFTVFVQGSTIKPLVNCCNIARKSTEPTSMLVESTDRVIEHVMTGMECITETYGSNRFRNWLSTVDECYLRPYLQKDALTHDQQILEIYCKVALKEYEQAIQERYMTGTFGRPPRDTSTWYQTEKEDELPDPSDLPPGTPKSTTAGTPTTPGSLVSVKDEDETSDTQRVGKLRRRFRAKRQFKKRSKEDMGPPTAKTVRDIMRKSTTSSVVHYTFDRNLTRDDDRDIMHHLQRSRELRLQLPNKSNALLRSLSMPSEGHRSRPVTLAAPLPLQRQSAIEGELLLPADGRESAGWKRATVSGAGLSPGDGRTPEANPDGQHQVPLLRIHSADAASYADSSV